MQGTNLWESELSHALNEEGQSTAAESYFTDGLDSVLFPNLLGLTQPSTPMSYLATLPDDEAEDADIVMTVSTSFHPGSHLIESDLILSSSDWVLFYIHSEIIHSASPSALASFLSFSTAELIVHIPEPATILNILLHAVYQTSCALNSPSTTDLIDAVDKMPVYGIQPSTCIRPPLSLYTLLLLHAPLRPIEIYALAAYHKLSELAELVSSHLLGFPLHTIDDAIAIRIGPFYLKRLFFLHMGRIEAFKAIFLQPPGLHPATKECSFEDQKKLARAWALGSTYLVLDARPDVSNQTIQNAFEPLYVNLSCTGCQDMLKKRIRDVLVKWASVRSTISAPSAPHTFAAPANTSVK